MRALVTGATGYIGSRLVDALIQDDVEVVATARRPSGLRLPGRPDVVHNLALDVLDPESTRQAFEQAGPVDVAYYLVHALGEDDYETSDQRAAQNFATAAARAGVGRIVYLGGFVPGGRPATLSTHLRSRARVGQVLAAGPVEVVTLQAAVILGAGSTSFEIVRHLVDRLPVVPLPPFMSHRVQPIAIDDVLHYLRAAADPAVLPPGRYDIAGERGTTYAGLARTYAAVAGLRRIFVPVPLVPPSLAAPMIGPLVPVPNSLVSDLVASLDHSMVSGGDTIRRYVADPFGGLIGIAEGIRLALAGSEAGSEAS